MKTLVQPDIFQSLRKLVSMKENQFDANVLEDMQSLFAFCNEGMDSDSKKMLGVIILNALNKRINSRIKEEHIYLKQYDIPQIQLFNLLIEKFPFVKLSQQIVNATILKELKKHEEVTLIDIGAGQGVQLMHILEQAAENAKKEAVQTLKKLVVVAIEPFEDALIQCNERVALFKSKAPFEVEIISIHDFAENIDFKNIPGITKHVVVNASLALHHIPSQVARFRTFDNVRAINPAAFILIEPDVDHFEPSLQRRFENCFRHFHSVFCEVDQLDATQDEKNALKLFFGREIEDIIGKKDEDRFERHERGKEWANKLRLSNFQLSTSKLDVSVGASANVNIVKHAEGFIGLTYGSEPGLSIICAN